MNIQDNFEYWVHNSGRNFLLVYWGQYVFFYLFAIGSALRSTNPYAFFILGFAPYIAMLIFRRFRNPLGSLENSIQANDVSLYQRFVKEMPQQYNQNAKYRAGYFLRALLKEPGAKLNPALLAFRKHYAGINRHAIVSLVVWFGTFIVLWAYLYFGR